MQATLKDRIKAHLVHEVEVRSKQKKSFWCTESEANAFDVYHSFKGTLPTNMMTPETQFSLGMRKKLEDAVVEIFGKMNILCKPEPFKNAEGVMVESDQWRVDMMRLGVPITGYMDAIILEYDDVMDTKGDMSVVESRVPVEIKTSYGQWSTKELLLGQVKTSYVKQLTQYMDFMGTNIGYLFIVNFERDLIIDDIYQFVVERITDTAYQCGNYKFDLYKDVYERYKMIWDNYIVPDVEPKSEYIYKYPLDKINWRSLKGSAISSARNNRAVIGDWQVKYSGYKDLIIEREGTVPGYTPEELEYIKQMTKGFTTWTK